MLKINFSTLELFIVQVKTLTISGDAMKCLFYSPLEVGVLKKTSRYYIIKRGAFIFSTPLSNVRVGHSNQDSISCLGWGGVLFFFN